MQTVKNKEIIIGMILEDLHAEFTQELIQSVVNAIPNNKNIRLIVLPGKYGVNKLSKVSAEYNRVYNSVFRYAELCDIDGLIIHLGSISGQNREDQIEHELERFRNIPKIFIASDMKHHTTVNYDNEAGIREAVDILVNVKGLSNICMLGGRVDNKDARTRKEIFARCLAENGITFTENNFVFTDMSPNCEAEAADLLDRNPNAHAVFCVNDSVAKGLYKVMAQRGLTPGKDILVFGFDNTRMTTELFPPLASIGLADCTLGQKALELLLAKINGDAPESAIVATRLYGRESFPHEMYEYSLLELQNSDSSFIYRMFDDCFYRYRSEIIDRESVDLKRLFYEFMSRMLMALKKRYMSIEEFKEIERMIDKFFDKGALNYTDSHKFIKCVEKLQNAINESQRTVGAKVMLNRLFLKMKDCAIMSFASDRTKERRTFSRGRDMIKDFLIECSIYENKSENYIDNVVRSLSNLALRNAALYMFDEPVIYHSREDKIPEHINMLCVIKARELYRISAERQQCHVSDIFRRPELEKKCKGFLAFPVIFGEYVYGLLLLEITPSAFGRGEYISLQLGRSFYLDYIYKKLNANK